MESSSFLNLNFKKNANWSFTLKHILFILIWSVGVWLLLFRGDSPFLIESDKYYWLIYFIPIIYVFFLILLMYYLKWYYNLILVFYPFLVVFWFIPKFILKNGKIYLLSRYINFIYIRIKKRKSTIIHVFFSIVIIILLFTSADIVVRALSIAFFSYLYLRVIILYFRQSLQPTQLFGENIENIFVKATKDPERVKKFIIVLEQAEKGEKSKQVNQNKRIKRLALFGLVVNHIITQLKGFNSKKAFVLYGVYKLIGFIVISTIYFAFSNYQLFVIEPSSFSVVGEPSFFDFLHYATKTFVYGSVNIIQPVSWLAKSLEMFSFFTVGILFLIIVLSLVFTYRQERVSEEIKVISDICQKQNNFIIQRLKKEYKRDFDTLVQESSSLADSLEKIKKVIEKFI